MSFSVRCDRTDLEYNGSTLTGLFAQRRNLVRPAFYGMLRDIFRFNRESLAVLASDDDETTIDEYLKGKGYSREFKMVHFAGPAELKGSLVRVKATEPHLWGLSANLLDRLP